MGEKDAWRISQEPEAPVHRSSGLRCCQASLGLTSSQQREAGGTISSIWVVEGGSDQQEKNALPYQGNWLERNGSVLFSGEEE